LTEALTGKCPPSASMLLRNRRQVEGGLDCEKNTEAQNLIDELKRRVKNNELRFNAIFHKVTETSLLAISKYEARKRAKDDAKAKSADESHGEPWDVADENESFTAFLGAEGEDDPPPTLEETQALEDLLCDEDLKELEMADPLVLSMLNADGSGSRIEMHTAGEKMGVAETLVAMRQDLVVGDQVLLGLCWAREDERELFQKFPEVFMVDDTMSTNRQGRPLFVSASPGPHMKVFTPVRAFLPSKCRWVFDWLFRVSIPSLLGKEAISKTQLVLSDGDQNIYGAFDAARKEFYPQAKHGLCIYHLVTQTLNELEKRMHCTDEQLVKDQKETFKRWMFTWMSLGGVESEDEYEMSKKLMLDWLLSFRDE
jgi:hypothetical protein